jgi:hypothetical protein
LRENQIAEPECARQSGFGSGGQKKRLLWHGTRLKSN